MTGFEDFLVDLEKLIEKYKSNNTMIKVESDLENDIVKIFGEKISSTARAKNGIEEVRELAYTTAEHHPYWNILYNSSEIISTLLIKWNYKVSKKEIVDIEWAIQEITKTLEKIKHSSAIN